MTKIHKINSSANPTQIILIGGTSHIGKSTLGKALAIKLRGEYISTDDLARHPGRPWSSEKNTTIKLHVAEHYRSLSAPELLLDVLTHYKQNVLPQVMKLIQTHNCDRHLIIEGSALYPGLITNIVSDRNVRGIWLVGSYGLLENRIFASSNFNNASKEQRYLIYKFLQRTWLYNQAMINDLKKLKYKWIWVNPKMTTDKLRDLCCQKLAVIY